MVRSMTAQLDRAHQAEVLVDDITVLPEPSQSQPTSGATFKLSPIGLLILLCGGFLPVLDFFIVNVALPTMDTTLHASAPMLELVVAGYGTAYAVMLVVGGRLGDAFGRDRMFVAGITGFTISSLLCGIAPNVQILIVARIAQGLSAAMSQPQVLATFQSTLDGPKRARAIGLYASMGGIAASLGQLLGGALVHADIAGLSWRPIFLVNVPIGVAVLLLTRRFVPATRSPSPASVDLPGTALLAIAIVGLLVPLTEGRVLHWPVWIWALLAVSAAAAAAMVIVERRTERSGRTPLVPPSLVSLRSMRRGLGIAIPPMAVAFFAGTLVAPRLIARHGRLVVVAGLGLQAIGLVWLIDVMHGDWPHVSTLAMAAPLAVAGIGQAFALVGFFRIILADVPGRLAGIGSGVLVTMQQGSLALGVASLGTLFVSLADGSGGMRHAFTVVIGIQAAIAVVVGLLALRLPDPE